MLKQGTFINKQYNKFLFRGIWGAIAYAINLMTDSIISGNQLGETALEAVTIVYPLFSVVSLFASLLPLGISVMYGKAIGGFKQEEAYRISGTGLTTTILISVFLASGLWLIKMPFLNYYKCTGELLNAASIYYNWLIVYALTYLLGDVLYWLDITDGESTLFTVAELGGAVINILLSVALSRVFGIGGLGMATAIYSVFSFICYAIHLLKKSNNIKFHICLDLHIVKRAFFLSFSEYMYYLFLAVVDIILNSIIITYCGVEYLPAYSVVNLVFCMCEVFIVVDNSSIGLITCFLGEQNNHDIKLVFKSIKKSVVILSIALTVIFFFGAPLVPLLYGLETSITVHAAIFASRIMAFTALGFGTAYVLGCIICTLERPLLSCFLVFLNDVFCPLLLSLTLGMLWGFKGIVVGMSISSYMAIGIFSLVMLIWKGPKGFPLYVENNGCKASSFDLYVTSSSLIEVRDAVSKDLATNGYDAKEIELLLEELFVRIMEKNDDRVVLAECTLLYDADKVRIIIRDDGVLFNFVDVNNKVESLNAFVLNSLLENTKNKNYILTTSFNRNGFVFEKSEN